MSMFVCSVAQRVRCFFSARPTGVNRQLATALLDSRSKNHAPIAKTYDLEEEHLKELFKKTCLFLRCATPSRAFPLFDKLMSIHTKLHAYSPLLKELARIESTPLGTAPWHRDHVVHSCLVYCLGLYMYGSFPPLRKAIHNDILGSTSVASAPPKSSSCLSGGTKETEFSFRWRLASLLHDLAYPFRLFAGSSHVSQLDRFLESANAVMDTLPRAGGCPPVVHLNPANYFAELNNLSFSGTTAVDLIEKSLPKRPFALLSYRAKLRTCYADAEDHGILGALLIYKLADMLCHYYSIPGTPWPKGVSWDPAFLKNSLAAAAAAIAYHNIDHTSALLTSPERDALVALSSDSPLVGLLRVSDVLQDWDRPLTNTSQVRRGRLSARRVRLQAGGGSQLSVKMIRVSIAHRAKLRRQLDGVKGYPVAVTVL